MECECKYYCKFGYCSHLLALIDLFNNEEFVKKAKKGRPKNSEKALLYES